MPRENSKPWTFKAQAGGELEILLYEEIGQDFWTGEGTTAKSFAEDLKAAGNVLRIHLRVNSPGGNVFDGLAIYNTLLSHGATITAQVDGLAASIASVILMSASRITMGASSLLMIHQPYSAISGNADEHRKMAETLDLVAGSMIKAYRRHSKKTKPEIEAMMTAETWLDADQAIDAGFADEVSEDDDDADVAARVDLSKFRRVPQQIAARFAARASTPRVESVSAEERQRLALRLKLLERL
jgi:ATP-dependent Clp protease, protease subunit